MQVWMLSQFYKEPINKWDWPVCASYANGHSCPQHPAAGGWALVLCESSSQQVEAAAQDPRVQPYRTLWDPITDATVKAYKKQGAKSGMMLGQLIQLLAQADHGFCSA